MAELRKTVKLSSLSLDGEDYIKLMNLATRCVFDDGASKDDTKNALILAIRIADSIFTHVQNDSPDNGKPVFFPGDAEYIVEEFLASHRLQILAEQSNKKPYTELTIAEKQALIVAESNRVEKDLRAKSSSHQTQEPEHTTSAMEVE